MLAPNPLLLRISQAEKAEKFRALHERAGGFVIPNPWDAGTALGKRDGAVTREAVLRSAN